MRKLFIFIILITANLVFFAQLPKKWKEVSAEDFSYNREGDTSIHAVILQEQGTYRFDVWREELRMFYEVTRRILILDTAGISYNYLEIPYIGYDNFEEFVQFQAFTYNIDNKKIEKSKLKYKNINTIKESTYNYKKVIKFPDVKIGSIIEYRYTIASLEIVKPRKWFFQHKIPTMYSESYICLPDFIAYRLKIIRESNLLKSLKEEGTMNLNFIYHYIDPIPSGRSYRNQSFTTNVNYNFQTWDYTFVERNIPAFKNENYIDCKCNYQEKLLLNLVRIDRKTGLISNLEIMAWNSITKRLYQTTNEDYEIMTKAKSDFNQTPLGFVVFNLNDWESIDNRLNKHKNFGLQLIRALPYKPILRDNIGLTNNNNLKTMVDLYEYTKNNYKWDSTYSIFTSQNLTDLLNTKKGNSADINLLLVYLLRKAELEANPVIIKTVDKGLFDKELATISQANHVIVMVTLNGKEYFLDAIKSENTWYALDKNDLNKTGRVIKKSESKFVTIKNNVETYSKKDILISINKNNSVHYEINAKNSGYLASELRNNPKLNDISNIDFENIDDKYAPLKFSYSFEDNQNFDGTNLYSLNFTDFQTPFLKPYRTMPIYFGYGYSKEYNIEIHIPIGKEVIKTPPNKNIVIDGAIFVTKVIVNETNIQISFNLKIKKNKFELTEYSDLRNLFFDVEEFANTPIIFD